MEASRLFLEAASLLQKLINKKPNEAIHRRATHAYWVSQSNRALASYHYQKHELKQAKTHNNKHGLSLNEAIQIAETLKGEEEAIRRTKELIPSWKFEAIQCKVFSISCDAREAWNSKQFIIAFDHYGQIEKLLNEALKLASKLDGKQALSFQRIAQSTLRTNYANKAQSIVGYMRQRDGSLGPQETRQCAIKLVEAYEYVLEALDINPEPDVYRAAEEDLRNEILEISKTHPEVYNDVCIPMMSEKTRKHLNPGLREDV